MPESMCDRRDRSALTVNVSVDKAWKDRLVSQVDHLAAREVRALRPYPGLRAVHAEIVFVHGKNEAAFWRDDDRLVQ